MVKAKNQWFHIEIFNSQNHTPSFQYLLHTPYNIIYVTKQTCNNYRKTANMKKKIDYKVQVLRNSSSFIYFIS